jgi:hypothetical protein
MLTEWKAWHRLRTLNRYRQVRARCSSSNPNEAIRRRRDKNGEKESNITEEDWPGNWKSAKPAEKGEKENDPGGYEATEPTDRETGNHQERSCEALQKLVSIGASTNPEQGLSRSSRERENVQARPSAEEKCDTSESEVGEVQARSTSCALLAGQPAGI